MPTYVHEDLARSKSIARITVTCNAEVDFLPGIFPVMNLGRVTPFVRRDLEEGVPSSVLRDDREDTNDREDTKGRESEHDMSRKEMVGERGEGETVECFFRLGHIKSDREEKGGKRRQKEEGRGKGERKMIQIIIFFKSSKGLIIHQR